MLDESWHRYSIYAQNVARAIDVEDPEDTLMIQLMLGDVAVIALGTVLARQLYPEIADRCEVLLDKLTELGVAQEFFRGPPTDPSDGGSTLDEE